MDIEKHFVTVRILCSDMGASRQGEGGVCHGDLIRYIPAPPPAPPQILKLNKEVKKTMTHFLKFLGFERKILKGVTRAGLTSDSWLIPSVNWLV